MQGETNEIYRVERAGRDNKAVERMGFTEPTEVQEKAIRPCWLAAMS